MLKQYNVTQTDDFYRSDGSVGIPIPGATCAIFDDSRNELMYNKRGEIYVNTRSGMIGYYKKPIETEKYFYKDPFDTIWSCTGDIGYIDKDGMLFVEERAEDYTIVKGKKCIILMRKKSFCLMKMFRTWMSFQRTEMEKFLLAHIIFNETFIKSTEEYPQMIIEKLKSIQDSIYAFFRNPNYVPNVYKIRQDFPHASFGKRDNATLMGEREGFIIIPK